MNNQGLQSESMLDEAVLPVSGFITAFLDELEGQLVDEHDTTRFSIEQLNVDMPIELDLFFHEDGTFEMGTCPPSQHVETSFMPVFHKLSFSVVASDSLVDSWDSTVADDQPQAQDWPM
jgi:hypothetical protein